jgi:tRNA-splicing ligase RtcB
MLVDGIVYADERMMRDIRKDESLQQVRNVAHLPGIVRASIAMPDIHWGYGFPIVSPGGVGYDMERG